MPRVPRDIKQARIYHLISRFVDREWLISSEPARHYYLRVLGRALSASDWRCLAFAVMSNHIHLAVVAGSQPLASWLRCVHTAFAMAMNRAHDRIGNVFVRGPKALLVEPDQLRDVVAYIHNNPVRAHLVREARDSTWSSHRSFIGLARRPRWLAVREALFRCGFIDHIAFDRWVANPRRELFDWRYEQRVAADPPTVRVEHRPVDLDRLVAAIASELGMTIAQLRSSRRSVSEVCGREATVLCARRLGASGAATARALGISQQAVSQISRRSVTITAAAVGSRVLHRFA